MVHGKNRIPYWIDRRLTGLAGPEYHAIISFGLPIEPEDSQYGEYRFILVIGMLFIGLMFGGTLEQTAFADGPGEPPETTEPPVPDQNINSYLDQATEDSVNEMNATFQGFVSEAWEDLKAMAPSGDWEDVIQDIIPQIHADAESQGGIVGGTAALTNSCNLTKKLSQNGKSPLATEPQECARKL